MFPYPTETASTAWLRTDSPEQLDQLLDQIGSVDGVEKTTTSIILSSKIDRGQPV